MNINLNPRSRCSGQILPEAVIGLSLMGFAFAVVLFSTFLADNHIRTNMAARHAAWFRGESGRDPTRAQINEWFFYQPHGHVVLDKARGGGAAAGVLPGSDATALAASGHGPFRAIVSFGVDSLNSREASAFPFVLLKHRFPLMPRSHEMDDLLFLQSECQWDEVGDCWTDGLSAVPRFLSELPGL